MTIILQITSANGKTVTKGKQAVQYFGNRYAFCQHLVVIKMDCCHISVLVSPTISSNVHWHFLIGNVRIYIFRTRSRHLNLYMHVRTKDSLRIAFERSFWWKKACHTRGRIIDLVGDFLFVQFGVLSKIWKHLKIHPKKLGRECTLLSLSQIYGRKNKNKKLYFRLS